MIKLQPYIYCVLLSSYIKVYSSSVCQSIIQELLCVTYSLWFHEFCELLLCEVLILILYCLSCSIYILQLHLLSL